jgi:hypothetical protein
MQSRTASRAAAFTAAALLSQVVVAPSAMAEPSGADHHDASAEHRQDVTASEHHTDEDLTAPQPASNADFTGNGANEHGAYDSTRDGSASENGNGGGAATGQPCAGCVGNADNKNPPGQAPDGSDANNGYECDGNAGIGRSNPAHTGCEATIAEEPPTPEVPLIPVVVTETKTETSKTPVVLAAAAAASSETPGHATEVLGISIERPATAAAPAGAVLGTELTAPAAVLATTGAGSLLLAMGIAGLVLAAFGALLLVGNRRSTTV